jgi:hypothetical protein
MYPSFFNTAANRSLMPDAGRDTVSCSRIVAFRMRLNISAIGSLIDMITAPLPARFDQARNIALQSLLSEADPAQAKPAHVAARPPTNFPRSGIYPLAAITNAHIVFALVLASYHRLLRHAYLLPNSGRYLA